MGSWLVRRRLSNVSKRLRTLREELAMVNEQLAHLQEDADDLAVRALVADSPAAALDSNDARKHVDAMVRHREHVLAEIAELELRQDELLDQMTG
jgi:hypothetical protein